MRQASHTRSTPQGRLTAEFRLQEARQEIDYLSRELSRIKAAVIDVLHALPEDKGPALSRLRVEMAGRGSRRAA